MFKGMKIYAVAITLIIILQDAFTYGELDWQLAIETTGTMVLVSIPIFVVVWAATKIYENRNQIMNHFFKKEES